MASAFLRGAKSDDDESDDERKVVKSAKDKRYVKALPEAQIAANLF